MLTIAKTEVDVGRKALPETNFSGPPPLARPARELPVDLIPITVFGTEKIPVSLGFAPPKPPKRGPRKPAVMGVTTLVWVLERCGFSCACTDVTLGFLKSDVT